MIIPLKLFPRVSARLSTATQLFETKCRGKELSNLLFHRFELCKREKREKSRTDFVGLIRTG